MNKTCHVHKAMHKIRKTVLDSHMPETQTCKFIQLMVEDMSDQQKMFQMTTVSHGLPILLQYLHEINTYLYIHYLYLLHVTTTTDF